MRPKIKVGSIHMRISLHLLREAQKAAEHLGMTTSELARDGLRLIIQEAQKYPPLSVGQE